MSLKKIKSVKPSMQTLCAALLLLLLSLLLVNLIFCTSSTKADNPIAGRFRQSVQVFRDWKLADTGEVLPYNAQQTAVVITLNKNGRAEISHTVTSDISEQASFFFRVDCPNVTVLQNGEELYSFSASQANACDKDMFREYNVSTPALSAGDTLTVQLQALDSDYLYFQYPCAGDEQTVQQYIAETNRDVLITSVLALMTMIVALYVYFHDLFHGANHPDLLLLALFAALSALWILTDSGMAILMFRHDAVTYYISHSVPMLLTVTYLLFVQAAVGRKLLGYNHLAIACVFVLGLSYFLHNIGVISMRDMAPLFCVMMMVVLLCCTVVVFVTLPSQFRHFKVTSLLMLIVAAATLIIYAINKKTQGTILFRYALTTFIFVMLIVLLRNINQIETQAKQSLKLKEEKEQAEAQMMLSQINSHFFYNTVNLIRGLILADPDSAYMITGDFGKYVRYRVNASGDKGHFSTFKDELRSIRAYADICAVQMNQNLKMEYEIESDNFYIPTLTVEPFVENAIKHGIYQGTGEGTVTVKTEKAGKCWKVTVRDNGCGFDTEKLLSKDSVGIRNIRTRLAKCPGCVLTIHSKPGEGTEVTIIYPQNLEGTENETDTR